MAAAVSHFRGMVIVSTFMANITHIVFVKITVAWYIYLCVVCVYL